ncbi:MAG TPA: oligosaccharide flippase family protein [Acidobacteriaceae bacterium]|nr:oligosaccharide flippase family protein [Acidobacteriaceae bacterium]
MISLRKITGGVLSGWTSTLVTIALGVFMSPFLIHHLGVAGYGVWILVQSAVSYMYFLDLGLRPTVIRFTAEAHARGDHEEVSNTVSAVLWVRIWTAGGIFVLAGVLSLLLPHLFRIPTQYQREAQLAVFVFATTLASGMVFSIFSAVLSSLGWFDLLGALETVRTVFASLGLVPIVLSGHGLVAMALWQLAVMLAVNLAIMLSCFRIYPELKCRFRRPERAVLVSLLSLSLYVLICNCGNQLILYTDNLVVGAFVTAVAVSYYAVAGKMTEYVRRISSSILQFVMPLASSFGVRREYNRLQQLHLRGSQATLLVTYPVVITLFIRGNTLLRLWIDASFSTEATGVLKILTLAFAVRVLSANAYHLTLALDRQRTLAFVTVAEGVSNLVLSIILVHFIGLIGVAVGTLIPTVITSLFFWPPYLCRLVKMSTTYYVARAWLCPIAAMVPFAAVTWWAQLYWHPNKLLGFAIQTLALLPLVAVGACIVFWKDVPTVWRLLAEHRARAANARA